MSMWHLHLLNARSGLTRIMSDIRAAARQAVAQVQLHADLPDFDLVVKPVPGGGIPKWGVSGHAPAPGLIEITQDPDRFAPDLFIRTLVHEAHHLIRWEGPGYGRSLGEGLVSEGLAGHFTVQVLGGPPDPWDATIPASGVARMAMNEWARRDYDHARWFFGKGDLKNGTGYGLGHRLVAAHLEMNPGQDAVTLAAERADSFRAALRRLVNADGQVTEEEDLPAGDGEETAGGEAPKAAPAPEPEKDAVSETSPVKGGEA